MDNVLYHYRNYFSINMRRWSDIGYGIWILVRAVFLSILFSPIFLVLFILVVWDLFQGKYETKGVIGIR